MPRCFAANPALSLVHELRVRVGVIYLSIHRHVNIQKCHISTEKTLNIVSLALINPVELRWHP
jgi:hypothetical protein